MNFEECFELEKVLLKRILQASTAQMHEGIINQLNFWLQQTQLLYTTDIPDPTLLLSYNV